MLPSIKGNVKSLKSFRTCHHSMAIKARRDNLFHDEVMYAHRQIAGSGWQKSPYDGGDEWTVARICGLVCDLLQCG